MESRGAEVTLLALRYHYQPPRRDRGGRAGDERTVTLPFDTLTASVALRRSAD